MKLAALLPAALALPVLQAFAAGPAAGGALAGDYELIDRLVHEDRTISNAAELPNTPPAAPMRLEFGRPVRLQRFGAGFARYSLDAVQATWYRYSRTTGVAIERQLFEIGDLSVQAGPAIVRQVERSAYGPGESIHNRAYPVISLQGGGSVAVNMMLAPPALSRGPGAYSIQAVWNF